MQKNLLSYCGDLVKNYDPDRFLISMFAPWEVREDLWTLFAFNYEIAKTRSVVSESTLGLIRLQWWRDAVENIYNGGQVPAHEVLLPLAEIVRRHNLPKVHFDTLLYAREFDLEDVLPGNLEGLMNYADFTTTPLLKLAVQIMGDDPDMMPVQPVAMNVGLSDVLRTAPYHARNARCYWPEDLMKKYDVTRDNFFNFEKIEACQNIARDIGYTQTFGIKPENRVLKASNALAEIYFFHLKVLKYNIFSKGMEIPPPFMVLRLWFRTKF